MIRKRRRRRRRRSVAAVLLAGVQVICVNYESVTGAMLPGAYSMF